MNNVSPRCQAGKDEGRDDSSTSRRRSRVTRESRGSQDPGEDLEKLFINMKNKTEVDPK